MTTKRFLTSMKYVFATPSPPAVPVLKSDLWFPVHRIYCVGRNYADHAIEMGGDPSREPPFFFSKPPDAIVVAAASDDDATTSSTTCCIPYPLASQDVHHEVELVVAIGEGGVNIPQDQAMDHVFGFGVGIDLTRRDLQSLAKERSRPWDCAKGFDSSAPIGALLEKKYVADDTSFGARSIWLDVDGVRRQSGSLNQMSWSIREIISILSTLFHLSAGDLIFTGTPRGVGSIERGQTVTAGVDGLGGVRFTIEK